METSLRAVYVEILRMVVSPINVIIYKNVIKTIHYAFIHYYYCPTFYYYYCSIYFLDCLSHINVRREIHMGHTMKSKEQHVCMC